MKETVCGELQGSEPQEAQPNPPGRCRMCPSHGMCQSQCDPGRAGRRLCRRAEREHGAILHISTSKIW